MAQIKLQAKPAVPEIIREAIMGAMGGGVIALILKAFTGEWGGISEWVQARHSSTFLGERIAWFFSIMLASALCGLMIGLIYTVLSRAMNVKTAQLVTWVVAVLLIVGTIISFPFGAATRVAILIIGLIATFTATQA